MDGLHSLLDCSPPWMSCFSRRPRPRVTFDHVLHQRTASNVASFCLELLQDVHNTKHRDSVLLVSMYSLSNLGNSGIKFSSKAGSSRHNQPL